MSGWLETLALRSAGLSPGGGAIALAPRPRARFEAASWGISDGGPGEVHEAVATAAPFVPHEPDRSRRPLAAPWIPGPSRAAERRARQPVEAPPQDTSAPSRSPGAAVPGVASPSLSEASEVVGRAAGEPVAASSRPGAEARPHGAAVAGRRPPVPAAPDAEPRRAAPSRRLPDQDASPDITRGEVVRLPRPRHPPGPGRQAGVVEEPLEAKPAEAPLPTPAWPLPPAVELPERPSRDEGPPSVTVSIGRIEVEVAPPPVPAASAARRGPERTRGFDAYIRARRGYPR